MATRSWNRVELIGNLTRDPELRYTPQGNAVVTFSIATNRTFISDGEKKEEADFHKIVAWNKLAELCSQLLKKGNRVFVSGRLQNRQWEGSDGAQRNSTEIVIEDMILLTQKNGEYQSSGYGASHDAEVETPTRQADEMPQKSAISEEAPEPDQPKEKKDSKVQKEEVEDLEDLPF